MEKDELFEQAALLVVSHQAGSASLLQRHLRIGHQRASIIMDQLETYKIVGEFDGSRPRQVLLKNRQELENHLK